MKSTPDYLVSAAASDPALAQICDEIIERLQAGDGVDLASLALEHPEHADQLRRLLPALEALVDLGASAAENSSLVTSTQGTSDLAPRVLGDYRILREVGRGGMGVVYEAEQRSLSRRVALKVLPMAAALDVRQFQRFQLEAQAAACLHHNNIVPVFAVGTEGGVPFYAMQYIEGRTLADVIQELRRADGLEQEPRTREGGEVARLADLTTTALARSLVSAQPTASRIDAPGPNAPTEANDPSPSPLSPGEGHPVPVRKPSKTASSTRTRDYSRNIANLGLQAAEALDHAHTRGILHRDIKPANLLLDAEGRLWVTDFGLAQIQGNHGLTLSGDILGTLRYMSPEQALAKRVVIDGRTDLYSLGVTLYELLTLRPAIEGKDRAEIFRKIGEDDPTPLRKLNASVPQDLETIIHKALAKEPSERYASAKELADDLRNYLETRPIRARRPRLLDRAAKWGRRHTSSVAAVGVILVLAMIGLATSTILIAREQRRTAAGLEQADARFQFARKAVDEMYTEVAEKWLKRQPKLTQLQREFLEKALAFYEQFATERGDSPQTGFDASRARLRVGRIQRSLGMFVESEGAFRLSISQLEELTARFPDRVDYLDELGLSLGLFGDQLMELGRVLEAETFAKRSMQIHEGLRSRYPSNQDYRVHLAESLRLMGYLSFEIQPEVQMSSPRESGGGHRALIAIPSKAQLVMAEGFLVRSRDLCRELIGESPKNSIFRRMLAGCERKLGLKFQHEKRFAEAEEAFRNVLDQEEVLLRANPTDPDLKMMAAACSMDLANLLAKRDQSSQGDELIAIRRRAESLYESLVTEFPDEHKMRGSLLLCLFNRVTDLERNEDIEPVARRGVEVGEGLVRDHPSVPEYRRNLAYLQGKLGQAIRHLQPEQARDCFQRTYAISKKLVEDFPDKVEYRGVLGLACGLLAGNYATGPPDDPLYSPTLALDLARQGMELQREIPSLKEAVAWQLGRAQYRLGNWKQCIETIEGLYKDDPKDPFRFDDFFLAMAHWQLGDKAQARQEFERADKWLTGVRGPWRAGLYPDLATARRVRAEAAALLGVQPGQGEAKPRPAPNSMPTSR